MSLYLVKDDNGIVATGTLYDNGVARNLTGATLSVVLKVGTVSHTITGTADADQTNNRGRFTATFTSAHLAASAERAELEVHVTEGSNIITYPSNGTVIVQIRDDLS